MIIHPFDPLRDIGQYFIRDSAEYIRQNRNRKFIPEYFYAVPFPAIYAGDIYH